MGKQEGNDKTPQTLADVWDEFEPGDVVYLTGNKVNYIAKDEAKEWNVPWDNMYEIEGEAHTPKKTRIGQAIRNYIDQYKRWHNERTY